MQKNQNQIKSAIERDKPKGQFLAGWTFPEYIQYKRSRRWYFWSGLLLALLLIYSLFTLNILFGVIIILFVVVLYLQTKKPPIDVDFKIFEDGVQIGFKFYKYKEIKSFWVIYEPPQVKNLYLHFKTKIRPVLSVPLERQNPIKIRNILLKYVDEDLERDEESFSEILGRRLKI